MHASRQVDTNKMATDTADIIQAVEKHPCIWNPHSEQYRDKPLTEQSWIMVCEEAVPGWNELCKPDKTDNYNDVKKKWKNVREYFKQECHTKKTKRRRKYVYSNLLTFMYPILSKKAPDGSVGEEDSNTAEDLEENTDDECAHESGVAIKVEFADPIETAESFDDSISMCRSDPAPEPYPTTSAHKTLENNKTKLKFNYVEASVLKPLEKERPSGAEDEDLGFFRCLLPDIKKLNEAQKFDFKLGTMKLLKKIKYKQVSDPDSSE